MGREKDRDEERASVHIPAYQAEKIDGFIARRDVPQRKRDEWLRWAVDLAIAHVEARLRAAQGRAQIDRSLAPGTIDPEALGDAPSS